jgi:origin recognition complex subunit 2
MSHRTRRFLQQDDPEDRGSHDGACSDSSDEGRTTKFHAQGGTIFQQTSFDAYFVQTSAAPQTSGNIFTNIVPPLSAEEYSAAISAAKPTLKVLRAQAWSDPPTRALLFSQFARELEEGFNLLFYGFGSKRDVLNLFATKHCSKRGHVVVANGFQPQFSFKDLLSSVERIPGITTKPLPVTGIEAQSQRIHDFLTHARPPEHLYIIAHNIDAPAFRLTRARSCLSLLALSPYIHLVASVDHINAPLLWSSSESATRKLERGEDGGNNRPVPRGFAWLWHDMTTLAPYDVELASADRSSVAGASNLHASVARRLRDGTTSGSGQKAHMTETAAMHVLASVTQKAKKLFAIMATQQLQKMDESGDAANNSQQNAVPYDVLMIAARDNFVATNDAAFRALLGEFRDHAMVVDVQGATGAAEALWIPLRKDRLASVLASINAG